MWVTRYEQVPEKGGEENGGTDEALEATRKAFGEHSNRLPAPSLDLAKASDRMHGRLFLAVRNETGNPVACAQIDRAGHPGAKLKPRGKIFRRDVADKMRGRTRIAVDCCVVRRTQSRLDE